MRIEPVATSQTSQAASHLAASDSVVHLERRRTDAQRRRQLRSEVRRLTIRETFGRSWEQDNAPVATGAGVSDRSQWAPRR